MAGQLIYFFILTVLVTMIGSWVVVWHYGRRVLAGMQARSGDPVPVPAGTATRPAPAGDTAAVLAWHGRCTRRAGLAWAAAGLVGAAPVALVYLVASGIPPQPARWLMVCWVLAMVAFPVVAIALGWGWRRGLLAGLGALAVGDLLTLVVSLLQRLARGASPGWDQLANLVFFAELAGTMLGLPLLLLALGGQGRIRQVVPMVFGTLVLFALAPFAGARLLDLTAGSDLGLQLLARSGVRLFQHGVFVLLALPVGWLAMRRLRALARGHAAKRFSDLQLLARCWWLMVLCGLVIELVNAHETPWWGAPACALAGLVFAPAAAALLRRWPPPGDAAPPPRTLLFLRAFGWRARTERLFDRVGTRWQWLGPITMIAAPDVVARSIDLGDLFGWLEGREAEAFVRSAGELQARLGAIDRARDPDGRYRINEFCCADNTWRATVVALMDRCDAVAMDLRGVADGKAGCAFELGQLARRLAPQRVVLVIDGQTGLPPLREALGAAADAVTWHRMDDDGEAAHQRLFEALVAAAG